MAGMYPDNQTLEVFGKTVTWPGVNSEGKFTNGDFNDPLVPPSCIPADTINLVVDNLNTFVTSMGGEPNNTEEEQLASLFSAAAVPFSGIKRDAHGRAQVAAPAAADDIARKADIDAEIDAEASARISADNVEASARAGAINSVNNRLDSLNISLLVPGDIIASPAASRRGFLLCNGAVVPRTSYANLFSAIGTKYGVATGSTTFTIPDFRGCFLRGAGGSNVAAIGVKQGDAIRNITGSVYKISETFNEYGSTTGAFQKVNGYDAGGTPDSPNWSPSSSFNFNTSNILGFPIAPENRPINHAINWFIKH